MEEAQVVPEEPVCKVLEEVVLEDMPEVGVAVQSELPMEILVLVEREVEGQEIREVMVEGLVEVGLMYLDNEVTVEVEFQMEVESVLERLAVAEEVVGAQVLVSVETTVEVLGVEIAQLEAEVELYV